MPSSHPCLEVFVRCADAIRANKLIRRESKQDKEFHFQNWFKARLSETGLNFEVGGRNTYPDFRLVASTDGFEVKGLRIPDARPTTTAIAKFHRAATTGGLSSISSGVIPPSPMATHIRCSTWWFVTVTSSTQTTTTFTRTKA